MTGKPVERLPLVLEPEPLSEPGQEPEVGAERQWFERAQCRHGIERRKPFRRRHWLDSLPCWLATLPGIPLQSFVPPPQLSARV